LQSISIYGIVSKLRLYCSLLLTVRHTPITTSGTYDITATIILVKSGGNSETYLATYVIVVEEPAPTLMAFPILAGDICTDVTDLATCGVAPISTPITLTVPPGEPINLE